MKNEQNEKDLLDLLEIIILMFMLVEKIEGFQLENHYNKMQIKNVLKKGQYFVRKHVIIYIYKNNIDRNVIGIAVNTKICNAVKRNRIKRIIRET